MLIKLAPSICARNIFFDIPFSFPWDLDAAKSIVKLAYYSGSIPDCFDRHELTYAYGELQDVIKVNCLILNNLLCQFIDE
jgi:hypothetical protein